MEIKRRSAFRSLCRLAEMSVFIGAAVLMSACRKLPDSNLGGNMSDDEYLTAHYQDTAFDIVVYSLRDTALIVQNANRMLLGSTRDDVFGATAYHIYSQLRYDGTNDEDFGFVSGEQAIDSVVLVLPYGYSYPTENTDLARRPIRLSVHALTENLIDSDNADSVYNVSSEVAYNPSPFGSAVELRPRPYDTITDTVDNYSYIPSLRVRLDPVLGETLLSQPKEAYGSSDADFARHFPGLCLRSQPVTSASESAVMSFLFSASSLGDEVAHILVFYGEVEPEVPRYCVFKFGPVRFTKTETDYSVSGDPDLVAQLVDGDSTAGRRAVYIASSGGAYISCCLPNIRELFKDRRIIINRAHLVLHAAQNANGSGVEIPATLQIPNSLDDVYNPGGAWNAKEKAYRLILTRYLQHLFYGEAEPEPFYIYASTAERYGTPVAVKLNGPEAGTSPLKLELIYTEVKDTEDRDL